MDAKKSVEDGAQRDFHHPYTPYDIQLQFMNALYDSLEDGCVGLFESPTGTGKSLSLICGALTWLRDHKARTLSAELAGDDDIPDDEPEWVRQFAREERKKKLLQTRKDLEERLKRVREKEKREKEAMELGTSRKRIRVDIEMEGSGRKKRSDEDEFLLEDYESDEEDSGRKGRTPGPYDFLSAETREHMRKLGYSLSLGDKDKEEDELPDEMKIFYCSRTHSQLSQFVHELDRVTFPPLADDLKDLDTRVKQLSLGSRKNLCINPGVRKLGGATAINEKCLDLQQSGKDSNTRCAFLPTQEEKALFTTFRDHALSRTHDIEDLHTLGSKLQTCPYYGARQSLRPAELITLPYPLLLQKSAREALGLNLKGNIVIIDEAHNIMDAIEGMYSTIVTETQLARAKQQVMIYLQKFAKRLAGKNRVYVAQLLKVLESLIGFLEEWKGKGEKEGKAVSPSELMARKGADMVNIFKLLHYLNESKLARKVEGYVTFTNEKEVEEEKKANGAQQRGKKAKPIERKDRTEVPVLNYLQTFLLALTNLSDEGKIFCGVVDEASKEIGYKYMLLDPSFHFREIVEDARSVILAGGTMSPMEDYRLHLFPYLPNSRLRTLTVGHVIPKTNLLAYTLSSGPSNQPLEFTFKTRSDPRTLQELGVTLVNLLAVIPNGVVVFFPSYKYLEDVLAAWTRPHAQGGQSIFSRLENRKPIFQESKTSSSVEEVLTAYSLAAATPKGALLFAVVGGKMSEGINFNDALGRGVVMVGLPFPNAQSAEWRAKLLHVQSVAMAAGIKDGLSTSEASGRGKSAAREFYENACMRAVNQSVGRAIRHRGDYAVIVLVDTRYETDRVKSKLPGWIQNSLTGGRFADCMGKVGAFFREKAKTEI